MGKKNLKHGLTRHPLYPRWVSMMARCYNENHNRYHLYGARGIAVCAEWIESPQAYIDYITSLPNALGEGLSIDRIDNDGDYEPDNLRWATKQEQSLNTRQKRNFTGFLGVEPHGGKFKSRIDVESKNVVVGIYPTIKDAVVARDQYIIDNKLETRKLQILTRPTVSEEEIYNILIDNDQYKYFVEGAEELTEVLAKCMQGKLIPYTLSSDALYCTTCKSTFNAGLQEDYCPSCKYYTLKYINNGQKKRTLP